MKISVDIDCTPHELRQFFGLPEMEALQKEFVSQMKDHMEKGLAPEDMDKIMKNWTAGAISGMEQLQTLFQSALGGMGDKSTK